MAKKWKMNRAGLLNFWYYDDEVFDFEDGKLLLRGTNGSGKSVTMQSFLPVLLDGKKSPDRLDPFGSKSRRMADYLLGEKEISNRDERTGYLYVEYKKEGTEQYLTTGIGMQAKRNQPLKSWGFALTDNRRIGKDLQLFKWVNREGKKEKFPLSQTELETAIGSGGEVVSSNKEYMALVNKHIFGFETLEAYEDLIKLLIQLRSPKLSKDFKPTVIYEILEEALPPLTDEDLRYLSDSIEQMDQTKLQMEQLEREVKALGKLKDAYDQYNVRILADLFAEWTQARERRIKDEQEVLRLEEEIRNLLMKIDDLVVQQRDLNITEKSLSEKKERLSSHKVFGLEKELKEKKSALSELIREVASRQNRLDELKKRERETRRSLDELEQAISDQEKNLRESAEDLTFEAEESAFVQHDQNVADFYRNLWGDFSFGLWKHEIQKHANKLDLTLKEIQKRDAIKERIQEKNFELANLEKDRDLAQDEEQKWQETMEEDKRKLLHDIHLWSETHSYYDIQSNTLQEMARHIDELFSGIEYEQVKDLFAPYVHRYEDGIRLEQSTVKSREKIIDEELTKLKEEWMRMKAQLDPEPERDDATIEARKLLDGQAISYAPFYEVVEFLPDVNPEMQKRIESALTEMGVLDALIVNGEAELKHDRILTADPKLLSYTLADYLRPDSAQNKIPQKHVQDILQSIEMDGEAPVILKEDGSYQLGSLQGHAVPLEEIRFIGREARKRYREELLQRLVQNMDLLRVELANCQMDYHRLDDQLSQSKEGWSAFPASTDVRFSFNEMHKAGEKVKIFLERIKDISGQVQGLDRELQQIKAALFHLTEELALPQTAEAYSNAIVQARRYENQLNELHRGHDGFIRSIRDLATQKDSLKDLGDQIEVYSGEFNVKRDQQEKVEKDIFHIEDQLKLVGAEDVRRAVREVTEELERVKLSLNEVNESLPALKEKNLNRSEKLTEQKESLSFWSKIEQEWDGVLRKEWKRGTHSGENGVFDHALVKEFLKGKPQKERSPLEGHLTTQFHTLQPDLIEHKMRMFSYVPDTPMWMGQVSKEEWKPVVEQWKAKNTRNIVEFDQRGVKISPADLYDTVSREWSLQENRLDEMDKKLYEEILLNSVGHKLRGRIHRAEKWTEQMKELMESRDTSSGLKFSIKWRPRTADAEKEIDTKELIELLKRDAKLLSDHDLERITNHFRSKIKAAKAWLEEKGEGQTLLQVLKMVLDYRKWFSFVLYFERPNEPRRELTNHNFFKFSGGEKAMAMYIPLFTACYSRYKEAAVHAPFIISLDEAFAGVDENNINEMFEIVEQLDFNYIMNSQVLWGDYETVKSLSVCELVRPKNANYVTVIRYKWDGQAMQVQLPEGSVTG